MRRQRRAARNEQILSLLAQGNSIKAIARKLGVATKTVRRVRKGPTKRKPRPSKLDAFKPVIKELVVKNDLTAIRVLREIRALGYRGGYSVLKEYARSIRRRSRRRPHLRFETEKGKQGQVDLSDYTVDFRGQATDVVCFSMVFGYSRWQFIRFTLRADAHSVCHSHVLAFEEAGGAPHEMLYDRMKQVVLESYADHVVFHPLFAALVNHYGFKAVPLAQGYKEGKGKVENPFKYIFSDLLKGSTFHDLEDLNRKAEAWLRDIARVRKHGTTQERPLDRMNEERPYLIPLPPRPFVAAKVEERIVGFDFCIAWETNRYSVSPSFVGRSVKVLALDGNLDIYLDGEIIARHQLRDTRFKRYILPEHESEFRQHSTSRPVLQEQFLRLGDIAQSFTDGLVKAHGGAAGYHISEILKLADQVGVPRVLEALRHAARYGAFSHTSVARIVRGKQPPRQRASAFPSDPPPKHVAEYLKASGHSQRSLEHYERLLKEKAKKTGRK
jgi:transposase